MPPPDPRPVPTEFLSPSEAGGTVGGIAAGTRLDRFLVLERAGAGGMGTVFIAYDPQLERKVAIKLLHLSDSEVGGPEAAQERLLQEARAMARLDHPNVVRVYEAGVWEKRVFLVMEYVPGSTLRHVLASPERTAEERLAALLDAGRGLAAAHAKGLIHRDFKPDNVLVSEDGRVCVTDFGLARNHDDEPPAPSSGEVPDLPDDSDSTSAGSTQQGALVGTPAYMAPEQLMGQVADARSDQFAFCVTVWEAYAGARPFDLDGLRMLAITQLMSQRAEGTSRPQRSKGGPGVQGLAAPPAMPPYVHRALLRGLSVDPGGRFDSMDALLAVLSHDPRIKRRQRALAALAVTLALIGAGALVVQQRQARAARCTGGEALMASVWSPREKVALEKAFAGSGAEDAAAQVTRTAAALDAYAAEWTGMHHEACTATRVQAVQTEEVLSLRMVCLERRRKEVRSLLALLRTPDASLVDKAPQSVRGLPGVGACADVESLMSPTPLPEDPAAREAITRAHDALALLEALRAAGRFKEGATTAQTLWKDVGQLEYFPVLAEALFYRGLFEDATGRRQEAADSLTSAVLAADRGRTDAIRGRAALLLTRSLTARSELEEAALWLRMGEAAVRRTGGGSDRLESLLHEGRARLLQAEGKYAEALEAWEQARRTIELGRGMDAPERAPPLSSAANLLIRLGRREEAIPKLEEALGILERERGVDHPILIGPLVGLVTVHTEARDFEAAHAKIERALGIARRRYGEDHTTIADLLEFKATAYQAAGDFKASLDHYRRSLAIRTAKLPPDSPDLSYAHDGIGQSLLGLGQLKEAREALEKALSLRGPDPFDRAETSFALARTLWPDARQRPRARELAARAEADYASAEREDKVKLVREWVSTAVP